MLNQSLLSCFYVPQPKSPEERRRTLNFFLFLNSIDPCNIEYEPNFCFAFALLRNRLGTSVILEIGQKIRTTNAGYFWIDKYTYLNGCRCK